MPVLRNFPLPHVCTTCGQRLDSEIADTREREWDLICRAWYDGWQRYRVPRDGERVPCWACPACARSRPWKARGGTKSAWNMPTAVATREWQERIEARYATVLREPEHPDPVLAAACRLLSRRQRAILYARLAGTPVATLAAWLELSRERVRQIELRALARIHLALEQDGCALPSGVMEQVHRTIGATRWSKAHALLASPRARARILSTTVNDL